MSLNNDYKNRFDEDGFLILRGILGAEEIHKYQQVIEVLLEELRQEGAYPSSGVFVGLSIRKELFRQLHRDPRIVDVLEAIMGPKVEFWSDKVVFKPAGEATPWHHDWSYWQGSNKYSVTIAFDDMTPENGCLRFVRGSHKLNLPSHRPLEAHSFGNQVDASLFDEANVVDAPMAAGDMTFFHDLAVHSSFSNALGTQRRTANLTYRITDAEDPPYESATAREVVRSL